jgi:hypothetical protein
MRFWNFAESHPGLYVLTVIAGVLSVALVCGTVLAAIWGW